MKKLTAILMTLCLLFGACAAVADLIPPEWDSMPHVVLEDDDTTSSEASYEGEWVLNVAFLGRDYVDEQTLAGTYGFNFMPIRIADGKITQETENMNGEFVTLESSYVFESGELHLEDEGGRSYVVVIVLETYDTLTAPLLKSKFIYPCPLAHTVLGCDKKTFTLSI